MGLQDVVEETVGEVMAKCDALKRENEELRGTIKRLEREYYATAKAKFEARIAALEKENALLIQAIETGNTVWCAECNLPVRCCRCVADRLRYRIAKLEKVKEAAMKVGLSWGLSIHGALQELEDALNATE